MSRALGCSLAPPEEIPGGMTWAALALLFTSSTGLIKSDRVCEGKSSYRAVSGSKMRGNFGHFRSLGIFP